MTFRAYWTARMLLWEERWGKRIREAENADREEELRLANQYAKTRAALRHEEP